MKVTTLLLLLLVPPIILTANTTTIQQHLIEVNSRWRTIPVFTSSMHDTISISTEQQRIQLHFEYVLYYLSITGSHLTDSQQHYRYFCLKQLANYMKRGVFPENRQIPKRNPCFIDDKGNYCAVGFLLKQTGYDSIAQLVRNEMNYAYVNEIPFSYLSAMAEKCGFTIEELALIQPSYGPYLNGYADIQYTGRNTPNYCRVLKNDEILNGGCSNEIYPVQLSTIDSPLHGSIQLLFLPNDTFYIYQPDTNYTGTDSFHYSLLYGPGGDCTWKRDTAAVVIHILNQPGPQTTFIPGDGNYDGKLDNIDVLSLAKSIGQSGNMRAVDLGICATNYCTPWQSSYMANNLAACDANGNGNVTNTDLNGILSCFNQPYIVNFEDTTSYRLIATPYDTIINPGDSIYVSLHIERYGERKAIKAVAMVLELPSTATRVNLSNKQLRCEFSNNNPDIISNKYAVSYTGMLPYIHTGLFNTQDIILNQQVCTPFDSFAIVSIPIPEDSILSEGLFAFRVRSVYILDIEDKIVPVVPKTFGFRSNKTTLGTILLGKQEISLFPNPTTDNLFIQSSGGPIQAIYIYNLQGQIIKGVQVIANNYTLATSSFLPGAYIAEIQLKDEIVRRKWVKY